MLAEFLDGLMGGALQQRAEDLQAYQAKLGQFHKNLIADGERLDRLRRLLAKQSDAVCDVCKMIVYFIDTIGTRQDLFRSIDSVFRDNGTGMSLGEIRSLCMVAIEHWSE